MDVDRNGRLYESTTVRNIENTSRPNARKPKKDRETLTYKQTQNEQIEMQPADTYGTMAVYGEAIADQIDQDETLDEYLDRYNNEETEHYDHTLNAS